MKFHLQGISELKAGLARMKPSQASLVVKKHGAKLQQAALRRAVFRGHWGYSNGKRMFLRPTGATKRSIRLSRPDAQTAVVAAGTHYSGYLEVGTRYMNPQPFVGPALHEIEEGFLADLERTVLRGGS